MKKLIIVSLVLAFCFSASTALAHDQVGLSLNLAGGVANFYEEHLGNAQLGLELAVPIYKELHGVFEVGGSLLSIPLLTPRFLTGLRLETEDGLVANCAFILQHSQALDRERPDGKFGGGHLSLLVPITNDGIKLGTSVDYSVNPENDSRLLFVGLKLSLPIDLADKGRGNTTLSDPLRKH
jgi:hypothetical protein